MKRLRTFADFEKCVVETEERFREVLAGLNNSQNKAEWVSAHIGALLDMISNIRREIESGRYTPREKRESLGRGAQDNMELEELYPDLVARCLGIGQYYRNVLP